MTNTKSNFTELYNMYSLFKGYNEWNQTFEMDSDRITRIGQEILKQHQESLDKYLIWEEEDYDIVSEREIPEFKFIKE